MNRLESVTKPLRLLTGVLLVAFAAGCGGGGGQAPILGVDVGLAPTVTTTSPLARTPNVTGVAINSKVTATFSKAMDSATINTSTFTVACPAGTAITGTVAYVAASRVATFSHTANFPSNTTCTATITTGAKDSTGLALASNFVWTFTTGATADTTRPTVTLTVPADAATGVATNTQVTATFSEDMDPATISGTSFTLVNTTLGGTAVAGAVSYATVGKIATFAPTTTLPTSTLFTATVTTVAADLAGNTLAVNKVWTFTTGATLDTTPPTVTLVNPLDLATGVCINKTVNATFSEAMDATTITTATFTLAPTATLGSLVTGVVTYDAATNIASLNPTANLTASTQYTATVIGGTSGVKDLAGNALAVNKVWSFTTGTTSCTTAPTLGAAQNFAVIAAAGITNAAFTTAITGDMGTSPTVSVTGFFGSVANEGPGTVSGTVYQSADPLSVAGLARAAAGTAYQEAKTAAALPGFTTVSGNLVTMGAGGSSTFFPGVYHSTSSLSIGGATITLDAQGDANAVWIFDMESTLTTTPGGSVILANGAQAKNVFWRVGSSATLGAAIFKGTILADTTIILGTAAIDVAGRLLAGSVTTSGAVNFNDAAHTVVRPAP